jgi:hypothetical protein
MNATTLAVGDAIALAVVTLVGFGSHGELSAGFLPRMAAAFVPLCAGWFLLAPWLGLFNPGTRLCPSQLWRPAFVMLFAGPLATVVRGMLLGVPVIPSFAIVLTATSALGLSAWRGICLLLSRGNRAKQAD